MIPTLKLKSGNSIPKLGMGTWTIGGLMTHDPKNNDEAQINALKYGIHNDVRWIRTAQNYAEGYCEKLVGQAIKGVERSKLYIMVAVNQRYARTVGDFMKEISGSMKRLGVDYVDMFLIGGLEDTVSLKTVADGLRKIKSEGLAKDIGVGNYRLGELSQIHQYLGDDLSYNEVHSNLIIREPFINGVYEFCKDNNIVMGAYRPLQLGQLAKPGIQLLDSLANKYGKTQAEISLKWLLSLENIATMPTMLNHQHIDQFVRIFDWNMEKVDVDNLTNHFPIQVGISDCTPPKPRFIE